MGHEQVPATQSQADVAYDRIRQAIIEWELRPGLQVTEHQLASQIDLGRASVRSALTRLSHEGLVLAIPRRGYQIAPITFKYVTDVFGARLVIEPTIVRIVAQRGDPTLIAQLNEINEQCRIQDGPYSATSYRAANKAFHVALAHGAGNERLASITHYLIDDLQRILYLPQVARDTDRVHSTFAEHAEVIEAIRQRDPVTAERLMYDHIEQNKVQLIDSLIASDAIGTINLVES